MKMTVAKITCKSSDFLAIGIHYLSIFICSNSCYASIAYFVPKKEILDVTSGIA